MAQNMNGFLFLHIEVKDDIITKMEGYTVWGSGSVCKTDASWHRWFDSTPFHHKNLEVLNE